MRLLLFIVRFVFIAAVVACTGGISLPEQNRPPREVIGNLTQLIANSNSVAEKQLQQNVAAGTTKEVSEQQPVRKAESSPGASPKITISLDPVKNSTSTTEGILDDMIQRNWDALVRSIYVFGALSVVGFLYLGFRSWRLHRRRGGGHRRTGTRRYAPLGSASRGARLNSQEMEPLGQSQDDDDDDDEDTVFDTSAHPNSRI